MPTSQKTSSSLTSVGQYIIVDILRKMKPEAFCRLRRTCTSIDNIAKLHAKNIRIRIGLTVDRENISLTREKGEINRTYDSGTSRRKISLTDRLSGFYVSELTLLRRIPTDHLLEFLTFFNRQKGHLTVRVADEHYSLPACVNERRPGVDHFLTGLKPDVLSGQLCFNDLSFWAGSGAWNDDSVGCFELLRKFPRAEFSWYDETAFFVVEMLLEQWRNGLNLGKCEFVSVCGNEQPDGMTLLNTAIPFHFQFTAITNDVLIDESFMYDCYSSKYSHGPRRTTKYAVNVYKVFDLRENASAVLLKQAETGEREFYFAFVPRYENVFLHCKHVCDTQE